MPWPTVVVSFNVGASGDAMAGLEAVCAILRVMASDGVLYRRAGCEPERHVWEK